MSWDELVAAALIGTDRRPVEASVPDGAPPGLADTLAAREAEDRLLGAAAAWTVARRAGALAGPQVETAAPAPVDERPPAPGLRLQMMLEGTFPSLLPEWLELIAERGLRPPPSSSRRCSTTWRANRRCTRRWARPSARSDRGWRRGRRAGASCTGRATTSRRSGPTASARNGSRC